MDSNPETELRLRQHGGGNRTEVEALFGDKLLDLFLFRRLYARHGSHVRSGDMTLCRNGMASNERLASVGRRFIVDTNLMTEAQWAQCSARSKGTAVEALIGREFLRDNAGGGSGACQVSPRVGALVEQVLDAIEEEMRREEGAEGEEARLGEAAKGPWEGGEAYGKRNAVEVLLMWLQSQRHPRPEETLAVGSGPPFECTFQWPERGMCFQGEPSASIKAAREQVARRAVRELGIDASLVVPLPVPVMGPSPAPVAGAATPASPASTGVAARDDNAAAPATAAPATAAMPTVCAAFVGSANSRCAADAAVVTRDPTGSPEVAPATAAAAAAAAVVAAAGAAGTAGPHRSTHTDGAAASATRAPNGADESNVGVGGDGLVGAARDDSITSTSSAAAAASGAAPTTVAAASASSFRGGTTGSSRGAVTSEASNRLAGDDSSTPSGELGQPSWGVSSPAQAVAGEVPHLQSLADADIDVCWQPAMPFASEGGREGFVAQEAPAGPLPELPLHEGPSDKGPLDEVESCRAWGMGAATAGSSSAALDGTEANGAMLLNISRDPFAVSCSDDSSSFHATGMSVSITDGSYGARATDGGHDVVGSHVDMSVLGPLHIAHRWPEHGAERERPTDTPAASPSEPLTDLYHYLQVAYRCQRPADSIQVLPGDVGPGFVGVFHLPNGPSSGLRVVGPQQQSKRLARSKVAEIALRSLRQQREAPQSLPVPNSCAALAWQRRRKVLAGRVAGYAGVHPASALC
eukprot:jgi/Mesvir1/1857/Mv16415-RA.1